MTRTYTVLGLKILFLIFAPTGKNSLEEMKQNLVSYLPLRHRYANASHEAGIPLANIPSAMDHTTEVHHQSYERFIPGGTVDLYATVSYTHLTLPTTPYV